jgi:hypothetical protein
MLYTKDAPYVYSRDGVYYFNRRIPNDLRHYYRCPRIIISLRTKSARAAKSKSSLLAAQLNDEWMSLRWRSAESPLKAYLADQTHAARGSCQTNANSSQYGLIIKKLCGAKSLPLGKCSIALKFESLSII